MTTVTLHASAATSPTALQLAEQMALQQVTQPPLVDQHGGVELVEEGGSDDA